MNLSLISGFIIGSILMLSLIQINLNLSESSINSMSDHAAKITVDHIADVVNFDFRKIGYGISGSSVLEATAKKIRFSGDLEDDGVVDEITWEYTSSDSVLTRTVNGNSTPIKLGVVNFELSYYDALKQPTIYLDDIRSVKVRMVCDGLATIEGKYVAAAWEKTFTPLNIAN